MPLVSWAKKNQTVNTVHDGDCFAKEVLLQNPRTPEANNRLIETYHFNEVVQPSFIRPHLLTRVSIKFGRIRRQSQERLAGYQIARLVQLQSRSHHHSKHKNMGKISFQSHHGVR